MIIKNKELNKLLKKEGRKKVLTMYANCMIHLTNKQLDRVLEEKK